MITDCNLLWCPLMCSAHQLVERLGSQLENQPPHFGTRLGGQLLLQVESAVQQAGLTMQQQLPAGVPQLPTVHLPQVRLPAAPQLPSVHLPTLSNFQLSQLHMPELHAPAMQFPAIQMPSVPLPTSLADGQALLQSVTSGAGAAAEEAARSLSSVQQQLDLLQQRLLHLAVSADSSSLDPHFGTKALTNWLQDGLQRLSSVLHMPVLHMPSAGTPASRLMFGGNGDSGLVSLAGAASASVESIRASLQVLIAATYNSLPSDVRSAWTASLTSMREYSLSLDLQQLQTALLQLQQALAQLPQHGIGGYDLLTVCLVAAGAVAATAASVPSETAVAGGKDDMHDVLTHEYDAEAVAAYFRRRPVLVAQRSLQLAGELLKFGMVLLGDYWTNRLLVSSVGDPPAAVVVSRCSQLSLGLQQQMPARHPQSPGQLVWHMPKRQMQQSITAGCCCPFGKVWSRASFLSSPAHGIPWYVWCCTGQ